MKLHPTIKARMDRAIAKGGVTADIYLQSLKITPLSGDPAN